MREIPLTKGYAALVSDEDYAELSRHKWHVSGGKKPYAVRIINGRQRVYMHRYLLGDPEGFLVDHIDGNSLNNQRENLRLATHEQNSCNRTLKPKDSRIGRVTFRGVTEQRVFKEPAHARWWENQRRKELYGEFAKERE
jgi:hypothetical protein